MVNSWQSFHKRARAKRAKMHNITQQSFELSFQKGRKRVRSLQSPLTDYGEGGCDVLGRVGGGLAQVVTPVSHLHPRQHKLPVLKSRISYFTFSQSFCRVSLV